MRYIGSKKKLLCDIYSLIEEKIKNAETFCDIFSGTACVAKYFKNKYTILSNDILYFSYVIQKANIESNIIPQFEMLKKALKITSPLEYLNYEMRKYSNHYFEDNFSPKSERLYFSIDNAKKIDFIRDTIENWKNDTLIDEDEYYYLLCALIEAVPFISNIAGTYGAFNKFWDKRSLKTLSLKEIIPYNNHRKNKCYNRNANELIKEIEGDILYIDPPYNSRQYISNYHILETLAKYDFPKVEGKTGQRNEKDSKSLYCSKKDAPSVLNELISNAKFKHIILSYNTDGIIDKETIKSILCDNCKSRTFYLKKIPYRKYKSNKSTKTKDVNELLFYIEK